MAKITTLCPSNLRLYNLYTSTRNQAQPITENEEQENEITAQPITNQVIVQSMHPIPGQTQYTKLFNNDSVLDIKIPLTMPANETVVYHFDNQPYCVVPLRKEGYSAIYRHNDIKFTDTITWQQVKHEVKERLFVIDTKVVAKAFRASYDADYDKKGTVDDIIKIIQSTAPKLPFELIPTVVMYIVTIQLHMKLELLNIKESQVYQTLIAVNNDKYTPHHKPFIKKLITTWNLS